MAFKSQVPTVTVTYAQTGRDQRPNELGMRPMQERAYDKRGEQYLLIKAGAETVVLGSLAYGAPDLAARIVWLHGLK